MPCAGCEGCNAINFRMLHRFVQQLDFNECMHHIRKSLCRSCTMLNLSLKSRAVYVRGGTCRRPIETMRSCLPSSENASCVTAAACKPCSTATVCNVSVLHTAICEGHMASHTPDVTKYSTRNATVGIQCTHICTLIKSPPCSNLRSVDAARHTPHTGRMISRVLCTSNMWYAYRRFGASLCSSSQFPFGMQSNSSNCVTVAPKPLLTVGFCVQNNA